MTSTFEGTSHAFCIFPALNTKLHTLTPPVPVMPDAVQPAPRLLDQLRASIRYRHYSLRTEKAYAFWILTFAHYHHLKHPREMCVTEVTAFLNWLSDARKCAPATHNQALSAILFLYREVLQVERPWLTELQRPSSANTFRVCGRSGAVRTLRRRYASIRRDESRPTPSRAGWSRRASGIRTRGIRARR
ncbi:MAG: phage integrase N-terminal SAM-like domain-containing protein [Rhodocyclaceae bacterium]|nr:phage integrase N-terminal SAM-like domain-containing protein [Rhodocyclaceae bacterium]